MKRVATRFLAPVILGLFAVAALSGCGGDPPQADLDAAKASLDGARAAGAEKYASSELSSAQSAYDDAKAAFDAEAEKMFKDWATVAPKLAEAKSKADRATSSATQAKASAKSGAESAIAAASAAVQGARTSLDAAPAGKGTEGDIEQLRASLDSADADLTAARSSVSREDFEGATSTANGAKGKADAVVTGVATATARYDELVEANTPWYMRDSM
ncbi:MAG TPA: hypothetical protein DIC52_06470 [Candidatus Latescibacteria bacterium]|nr:hypothetical protein [Candidatus Latescibacterota bacterium]|tara:strand:+ start:520 stop:1167 length:648 start_codon:yes stop_codon:yes gene_type:complete